MFPIPRLIYDALPLLMKGFYYPVSPVEYSASLVTETTPHQTK